MKKCQLCLKTLPLSDFYKFENNRDGHMNRCKECHKKDCVRRQRTKVEQIHSESCNQTWYGKTGLTHCRQPIVEAGLCARHLKKAK